MSTVDTSLFKMSGKTKGLMERLRDKEEVIVAEGYLFEFERRGYLKAGSFVPEVIIEHPDLVKQLYEEFVHCGSDVVEAFTYYTHREKMGLIGREDELEYINRKALQLARQVANETRILMAGNLSNSTIYNPKPEAIEKVRKSFKEQIEWAVDEGADFIIAETFFSIGEAKLALKCIKDYGKGLPAVVTVAPSGQGLTSEGTSVVQGARELEELGADVVGYNCMRGPDTMLEAMRELRKVCKGPLACLPVPYRTHEKEKLMVDLTDQFTGEKSFPVNLDSWLCARDHITRFTNELKQLGVLYMGLCCGNRSSYIRAMAEALGRSPPACKYSPDMSLHFSKRTEEKYEYDRHGFNEILVTGKAN